MYATIHCSHFNDNANEIYMQMHLYTIYLEIILDVNQNYFSIINRYCLKLFQQIITVETKIFNMWGYEIRSFEREM